MTCATLGELDVRRYGNYGAVEVDEAHGTGEARNARLHARHAHLQVGSQPSKTGVMTVVATNSRPPWTAPDLRAPA